MMKAVTYGKISGSANRFPLKTVIQSRRSKSPASVNGTPASQLSTPHSPSPSPTGPGSLSRRREQDKAVTELRPTSS
ncbi:transcript variant X1 [Nothobranchius furzeri]|uniref:Transcript variant X1 n=1 Tax=Nothobranchius furzeri TaxID=105023 RepID=A0A9D3BF49_NOTFU|nr:transcript variant X1 [Nothobranchius furzeri]